MLKFFKRKTMQEIIISLKIEKDKPLQLKGLSRAILALNQGIGDFVEQDKAMGKVELQLQSVEKGSDIFHFLVSIPTLLPISECIESLNRYFTFWENLRKIKNASVQEIKDDEKLNKNSIKCVEGILQIYDIGANATISNSFNTQNIIIGKESVKDFKEAVQMIKDIKHLGDKSEAKTIYPHMMIEFYQTTNTQKDIKHKAYCYDLSPTAKGIIISDETLKAQMLENPYNYRFLVDLEVYKDESGQILNYRAFNYHDKIEKES